MDAILEIVSFGVPFRNKIQHAECFIVCWPVKSDNIRHLTSTKQFML